MSWRVELQRSAEKELKRVSAQNRAHLIAVDPAARVVRVSAIGDRRDVYR